MDGKTTAIQVKNQFFTQKNNFSKQLQVNMHFAIKCFQLMNKKFASGRVGLATDRTAAFP